LTMIHGGEIVPNTNIWHSILRLTMLLGYVNWLDQVPQDVLAFRPATRPPSLPGAAQSVAEQTPLIFGLSDEP